jgi:hypothetical protein
MLSNRNARGKITYPRNRDSVPRLFRAEGTVDNLPPGQQLVLAVEIGGLLWPKGKVQVNGRSWASEVYEGGSPPSGKFALSLYLVSDTSYGEIAAWLEHGRRTGDYPGLGRIREATRLHIVKLRLET